MVEVVETRSIRDEILPELESNDRFDVYQAAVYNGAFVNINERY